MLNKIYSNYIINNIFDYIQDINFKFKIFLHSKYFQKRLNINLTELKEKYLNKIKFYIDKYLYTSDDEKSILRKKYQEFLDINKIDIKKFENMIYDIYQNKIIEDKNEKGFETKNNFITIYSPLFDILSKTKNFEKIFIIYMSPDNNSKEDYIKVFNNLNKLNKNLSIFYHTKHIGKFKLKEFNIKNIKRLTLDIDGKKHPSLKKGTKYFYNLFSIQDFEKNLIYFKISFKDSCSIDSILFESIKNFKMLKYLYIENLNFHNYFYLKLNELIVLSVHKSNLIYQIKNTMNSKLKVLYCDFLNPEIETGNHEKLKEILYYNYINNTKGLEKVNINNLEILKVTRNSFLSDINILAKANFIKLKILDLHGNEISNIKILEKAKFINLENLNLSENKISNINVFEKVNFVSLKELDLHKNIISEIVVLEKFKFIQLENLNLSENKISNINIFERVNFPKLKKLDLNYNPLRNIDVFEKIIKLNKFKNLEFLSIFFNKDLVDNKEKFIFVMVYLLNNIKEFKMYNK